MSTYVDKPLSLIERKKQQWAREREELAGLTAPWSSPLSESQDVDKSFQRNRYVSKVAMAKNEYFRRDFSATNRRPSLPPLYKNQYNSIDRDNEKGGETSGYGSDNPNQTLENAHLTPWNQSGYESSSSYKDDRPKWKEKTNRFWDAKENEPPNWVKRGLQTDEEIVVSNMSPAESPQQEEGEPDRPCTSSSNNLNRTYIRGQNIPMDSTELAERERRRQIALAHQEAVRQQLEDRERRRREEREKRIKEEQEEELRIEREQEIERQRKDQELKAIREKQERERKRKEAIKEALEIAEREAKLEKMKIKMMKQNNVTEASAEEPEPKMCINVVETVEDEKLEKKNNAEHKNRITPSPRPEMLHNEISNNFEIKSNNLNPPKVVNEPKPVSSCENLNNNNESNKIPCSFQFMSTPRSENVALVMQTPLEGLHNMQYAVLMPTASAAGIPVAIPLAVSTDRSCNTSRTENRILTPTQYRNRNKRLCDSSTQTEDADFRADTADANQKFVREKINNLDLNYDSRSSRKERRSGKEVEERPKWGANRPPTRYLKQSEKDPLYQRRKLRQKMRDVKVYDYKNSSDESQTGSPRSYRKKSYADKRHTRALWRKSDHFFTRNIRMYQTEIVPLESDKEQIYYREKCECCCRCSCSGVNTNGGKPDILKIDHNSPRSDRLPDCKDNLESAGYILDKLTALHNGLLLKQEQWERSPRTPSLSSSTRNTENN